jgi:hypothetical protein
LKRLEALGSVGRPGRIDPVHLAQGAFGEEVDRREVVGLTLGPQFLEDRELGCLTPKQTAPQLRLARHEQVMKGADGPLARRVASIADATVLRHGLKRLALGSPTEDVSFVNRVQGVDENERAGYRNAGRVQALAKAAEEIGLAEPAQSGLAQEGEDLCRARLIHSVLVARN